MNYFRRTLPSLDALVFFEAAARLRSFTRAGAELHVSQVAVSKRVRALEADLGVVLVAREGRGLVLTAEGQALAERVQAGLAFVEEALTAARSRPRAPRQMVQGAANENIHFFWLAPLVRAFQMAGNEAVVSVVSANNVSDVVRAETDLAIFHGKVAPEGWLAHPLFDEIIAPVAAPSYSGVVTLLDYRKEAPEWVNWETLAPQARAWFPQAERVECSSYIQSISHAIEGRGVGLGVLPMLSHELRAGRLVPLAPPIPTGLRYFLATPQGRPISTATAALVAALREAARNGALV